MNTAFAVWLTGLPASGKSTIACALQTGLRAAGLEPEVLESDAVRKVITPAPTYFREERDLFYRALAFCGGRLAAHGVPVIIDAAANRREYRDLARTLIPHFLEVAVMCPLEVCQQRDRKGTYRKAVEGKSTTVPGLQESYDPPLNPEVVVDTSLLSPEAGAARIIEALYERGYLAAARGIQEEVPPMPIKTDGKVALDVREEQALARFMTLLQKEQFGLEAKPDRSRIARGPEGQIIVPVLVGAATPSVSMALLMGQKAEHLYKQTTCRFVLAQRPEKDPQGRTYVWDGKDWRSLL
jgi:adenylylsulfate kinase